MTTSTKSPVLLHVAYPLRRKIIQLLFARAKELSDEGTPVVLTYCDAKGGTCANNFAGSKIICGVCQSRVRSMATKQGLPLVPVHSIAMPPNGTPTNITVDEDYLEPETRESISEGVQSAVTTMFRVLPTDDRPQASIEQIKLRYQQTSERVLGGITQVMKQHDVCRIEVFNGRQACSRVAVLAAKIAGKPFNTLELLSRKRPILFRNHVAHDRHAIQDRMKTHPADFEHAEKYFANRRKPKENQHAKGHASEFSPPESEGYSRRVSIFLSSQDEFEALGKDWESPFRDNASVIERLCRDHEDILFCIRFHPNQSDIASDILSPYSVVDTLPNARLFYPNDSINSYELMQWSDAVITFGSTVTIESCWIGKPVVLLGPSFFDELDAAYTPANLDEASKLLAGDLAAKPRDNVARAAHYLCHACDEMKYVSDDEAFDTPEIPLTRQLRGTAARMLENLWCHLIKYQATSPKANRAA